MAYIPTGNELIDPFRVLQEAGIRSGMRVADFGCGTLGHYVFPAAHLVGAQGQVFAVDILKSVLNGIESRMKMEGTTNVKPLWGDIERERGVKLENGYLDIGLLINNLFMSKHHEAMLRECLRTVKPSGKFVLIDWKPTGMSFGPDPKSRISAEDGLRLAESAGLKLEKEIIPGSYHWGYVFNK